MYKLSLKLLSKIQWFGTFMLLIIYYFNLENISMLRTLLFHHYITLICNHVFIFFETKKVSITTNIMPNLITRLGYKGFINSYIANSFIEMFIFCVVIYGPLVLFQSKYMFDFEWNLLPMALILNTSLYIFFTICFCLKILTNNRFFKQILTFLPVFANVVFHYLIIPNIYEPIYYAYSHLFY